MVYSPEEVDAYRKEKGCYIKRTVIIRGIRTELFSCHRRNKNGGCTYQFPFAVHRQLGIRRAVVFRRFISISTLINTVISVIFPIILLTVLNVLLLCALRRRQRELAIIGTTKQIKPSKSTSSEGLSQQMVHSKTEQRVTWTVTLIVSMFTFTNGPSAVINLIEGFGIKPPMDSKEWYNWTLIASTLVILGKVSNFILFCLSSKHFRRRLFALAQKRANGRLTSFPNRHRSSYTAMSSTMRRGTPNKCSMVGGEEEGRKDSKVPMPMVEGEKGNGSTEKADGERKSEAENGTRERDGGQNRKCESHSLDKRSQQK
ncbi:hypothetical protein niasHT_014658 [Heterodera trifolii]|uniref:G-protein coupled receptors family 1 profile domain-containing protein n=1 Tax=Heterodera trifolii TaxID=157864 RepID=A0ABD2LI55_9BILA